MEKTERENILCVENVFMQNWYSPLWNRLLNNRVKSGLSSAPTFLLKHECHFNARKKVALPVHVCLL